MFKFDTFNIDFLKYSKLAFILSSLLIFFGLTYCLTAGIKQSIDFTGGTVANISINKEKYDIDFLRKYLSENLDENISIVQESFDGSNYTATLPDGAGLFDNSNFWHQYYLYLINQAIE